MAINKGSESNSKIMKNDKVLIIEQDVSSIFFDYQFIQSIFKNKKAIFRLLFI